MYNIKPYATRHYVSINAVKIFRAKTGEGMPYNAVMTTYAQNHNADQLAKWILSEIEQIDKTL